MLQQTTVPHAIRYFLDFTSRWPTVFALASETDDAIMAAFAGLGYYSRARALINCARKLVSDHGGQFPKTEEALRDLPGIGPYTSAAIAAIAFDVPANVVDGNIERIMARVFAVPEPLPDAKSQIKALAASLVTPKLKRPGDYAQALMDLGATVCRPKKPNCSSCPLSSMCRAYQAGAPDAYPKKAPKPSRPLRQGCVFLIFKDQQIAVIRRPPKGLLGGMMGLPTTDWDKGVIDAQQDQQWLSHIEKGMDLGTIRHQFTHFQLSLQVFTGRWLGRSDAILWLSLEEAMKALPSVFVKALKQGLDRKAYPRQRRS